LAKGPQLKAPPRRWPAVGLLFALLFVGSGCALLRGPEQPALPTPPPSVVDSGEAIAFESLETGGRTTEDTVVPVAEPAITGLMEAVSKQNLFAYVQTLQNFGTRHPLSPLEREGYGIGAASRWIYDEFERIGNGRLEVAYHEFPFVYTGFSSTQRNVVATLPGLGGHQGVLILTAHYDSRTFELGDGGSVAPGANDNASGVAVLVEAARLLSARSWQQTVIFVAFAAEEQGTYGSDSYVRDVMLEGMIVDAAINLDTVGGRSGIPQSVNVFAAPEGQGTTQLARYLDLIGDLYQGDSFDVSLRPTLDRPGRYGDQRPFVNAGVAAVRLTESQEDVERMHTDEDTADRIDYNYLVKVARLTVVALANMAGAPPLPPAPAVAPMADAGSYLLSWSPDPGAAAYAVAFRPVGGEERALRYISAADAGNVVITGLDPGVGYAISLAPLDAQGLVGLFSQEVVIDN